jgi:hypothetical protein
MVKCGPSANQVLFLHHKSNFVVVLNELQIKIKIIKAIIESYGTKKNISLNFNHPIKELFLFNFNNKPI